MYGDGGRLGVVGTAEVVAGIAGAGALDQQVGGGRVPFGRDDADAAAHRAEAHHLRGEPHHTSQCLENTDIKHTLSRAGRTQQ